MNSSIYNVNNIIYRLNEISSLFTILSDSWFNNDNTLQYIHESDLSNLAAISFSYELQSSDSIKEQLLKYSYDDSFKPLFVKSVRTLTESEINALSKDFSVLLFKNSHLLKELQIVQHQLKELGHFVQMSLNIKRRKKTNSGYFFSPSCRQFNYFCSLSFVRRPVELQQFGYDGNYDFKSAIYSVARVLNTNIFDPYWDIKKELKDKQITDIFNNILDKNAYKQLSFRMFFASSKKQCLNWMKNAIKRNKKVAPHLIIPILSDEDFNKVYFLYQTMVSLKQTEFMEIEFPLGTGPYIYNIFLLESYVEIRILLRFKKLGLDIKNVYDCFYYKSSQITNDEVVKIICDEMHNLYKKFGYLSSNKHFDKKYKYHSHYDSMVKESLKNENTND